ncbi:MAG: hypothetical protein WDA41_08450 [Candidatus Neomarinimicrobiota bacterium]|jgi:hypothetical protein
MTEEQAKTKECRQFGAAVNYPNCSTPDFYFPMCIASDCMMWVVEYKEEKREGHDGGKEMLYRRGVETNREMKQESYDLYVLPETGHCGLCR